MILVGQGYILTAIVTFHMFHSLSALSITFTVNDVLATLSPVSLDSFLLSPAHEHILLLFVLGELGVLLFSFSME